VTKRLLTERFSLFPIFRINDPAHALLVTKTGATGPYLDDLTGNPFAGHLSRYTTRANAQPLRTWCLSAPAPMLASLSELRVLQPAYGSLMGLEQCLTDRKFARPDAPGHVTLPATGVQLVQTPVVKNTPKPTNGAPDHLYRLFAYNHLMQQVGSYYFDRNRLNDKLIREAEEANIVTPVSGLVVLETQKDYDRFGIKRDLHGLANATLKSEGAVPEPHEWAMLALLLVLLIGLRLRQRYVRA
jgi:XrtN system VIT domain protein